MTRFAVPGVLLTLAVVIGCGSSSSSKPEGGKKDDKAEEIDIVGRYTYKAKLAGGGEETGTVDVKKDGDNFKLEYIRSDKLMYSGVAIRTNDLLSICWSYAGAGERGVGVYKITSGPKLVGHWATLGSAGKGKQFPDTWTAIPPKK